MKCGKSDRGRFYKQKWRLLHARRSFAKRLQRSSGRKSPCASRLRRSPVRRCSVGMVIAMKRGDSAEPRGRQSSASDPLEIYPDLRHPQGAPDSFPLVKVPPRPPITRLPPATCFPRQVVLFFFRLIVMAALSLGHLVPNLAANFGVWVWSSHYHSGRRWAMSRQEHEIERFFSSR